MKKLFLIFAALLFSVGAFAQLTATQQTQLAAAINADAAFNSTPHTSDGAYAIALAFNQPDSSNTNVWWTACPAEAIFNSLTWTNYTPNDAVPTDTTLNSQIFLNRMGVVNIKQMNLQNMLVGRQTINMANSMIRAGIRDAVIQLPTGVGGAMTTSGGASGATTLTACLRPAKATRAEKVMSAGPSTTGTVTADTLTFEGSLGYQDVGAAMGWSF